MVRYIEKNPVRARLVKKAEDWNWSSARTHLKGCKDAVLSHSDWLTQDKRDNYIWFFTQEGNDDIIRKVTSTGRPLGSIGFVEKIGELLRRK